MDAVTWFQIVACAVAAIGIAISVSMSELSIPVSLRICLCAVGAGLVITLGGLITMNIHFIKVGHLVENVGLCGAVIQLAAVALIRNLKQTSHDA